MKLVSINTNLLEKYKGDQEVLTKSGRPYVLVIRLKYKGQKYDFAVPIRSNIPAASPKISTLHCRHGQRQNRETATVFIT